MTTMSAVPFYLVTGLVSEEQARAATDDELAHTIADLIGEQQRRALEGGDIDAIAEEAFNTLGFDRRGLPNVPYLSHGLLVCPGAKIEKSVSSHDCQFVSVQSTWVWEHADIVYDHMRTLPTGKIIRQSVTILPAYESLEYDVVASTSRSGPCQMKTARSFEVREGQLVETHTRARAPEGHR